ncbi:hypothetical protein P171DRAFT_438940 [Karstenula rhodostoma CBS 690.94]|uniref:Protein SSH4 n=1 Tax=Karstenula rhodostoma CBS 690.94 TaxID=1392251 RepID=A0A9P4UIG1_9PLEO|nr:hypothetical protein P171DRAFT_438940 [Karstenula rhodostoma CBS 690.94]
MVLIRAIIRRRLGIPPSHCLISAGYEIDYLATRLVSCKRFRNYEEGKPPEVPLLILRSPEEVLRWEVRTAMDYEPTSNALESALSLSSSIEAFRNTLPLAGDLKYLDWNIETVGHSPTNQTSERHGFVNIPLEKHGEKWRADIGKIEAIISLWMAATEVRTETKRKPASGAASKSTDEKSDLTDWRRTKVGSNLRYRFCRILGNDLEDDKLKRDLSWWIDELIADKSDDTTIHNASEDTWFCSKAREEEVDLIIGFNGRGYIGLLPLVMAKHMFTSFMWTVFEQLPGNCLRPGYADTEHDIEIKGRHTFDLHGIENTWHRSTLRHKRLTNLVRELEKNGLGKYIDILLCMIPALSSKDPLPNHVMFRLIPPLRQGQSWTAITRAYSSLLRTKIRTSLPELFCYNVVIGVMDCLQFASEPYDSHVQPQKELGYELQRLIGQLKSPRYRQIYAIQRRWTQFEEIFNQYGTPSPSISDIISIVSGAEMRINKQPNIFSDPPGLIDINFCIANLGFSKTFKDYALLERENAFTGSSLKDANLPDIFGWYPLHYAALSKDERRIRRIFRSLLDRESLDIHTLHDKAKRILLHVAMTAGNDVALAWTLDLYGTEVKKQAINSSGLDQMMPLHLSKARVHCKRTTCLQERRLKEASSRMKPFAPLHSAADEGNRTIAELLLKSAHIDPSLKDETGRTPLDVAVQTRSTSVAQAFLTCATIDEQIRPERLGNLSVNSYATMCSFISTLPGGVIGDDLLDDDHLKVVELSEDLRDTAAYDVVARWALDQKTTQMKVKPGPMHIAVRLDDLELMTTICTLENIGSTGVDEDSWTCVEYANTYLSHPVSEGINQLAQQNTPAKAVAQGRIMPASLKLDHIAKSICDKGCSDPEHGSCIGFHSWSAIPFAYHGDDGALFVNTGEEREISNTEYVPGGLYGAGDTVGFGLNLKTGEGFVTRNGEKMDLGLSNKVTNPLLGEFFQDPENRLAGRKVYPCVGFDNPAGSNQLEFEWNLGALNHPFMYQGSSTLRSGKASM